MLCTYNGERFLQAQIDSLLQQTYTNIEIIISDDASSDMTHQILQKYNQITNVFIIYNTQNMGLTRNFSFAASQATGALITFSDQDDIWREDKIEKLASNIGKSNLIYSDSLLINKNGISMHTKLSDLKNMYSGDDSRCYIFNSCVSGHGMMITRHLLESALPIPEGIQYDFWITYQAFLHGGIKYLNEVLTYYRKHDTSLTQTFPKKLPMRKKNEQYLDYQKELNWIQQMQKHERMEYEPFYQQMLKLYSQKEKTIYSFSIVIFMLKFRKILFALSKKSFLSNFIEILKRGRGEQPS